MGIAIIFTKSGNIEILADVEHMSEAFVIVRFRVADSGIGIPATRLETIFGEFEQAEQLTTRKYGGTGLGLSFCKRLVELMDGRIWVESQESRFSFESKLLHDSA